MVPVELSLTNFLSYGTAAPALDFEQFHVACLSGRNGQGKSALLDAITWALFGEARKSSDNRKPDADLIRIGAQHMQVELVFDLEGERYRVTRAYSRSASGKTSRPDLEINVYEADRADYRPLTGGSIRETQEILDRILGVDYDTFINSAFLLQGRSDEFTKKRPSERKQILARILNLSKYDRLAERARVKERTAADEVDRADLEVERLKEALEPEPTWKAELGDVTAQIEAARSDVEAARRAETEVAERMATLDARAREANELGSALKRLAAEREQTGKDAGELRRRIEEAAALIARREEIQRDYERYEALAKERDDLHTKSELYRGVERQLLQKEQELKDRRHTLERQVERLEQEARSRKESVNECTTRLAQEPAVRERLQHARTAREQLKNLDETRRRRDALDAEIETLGKAILAQRGQLEGRLQHLGAERKRVLDAMPDRAAIAQRRDEVRELLATREEWEAKRDQTRDEGQELRERMEKRRGQVETLTATIEQERQELARLRDADEGPCPTCGSPLTESHRAAVAASMQAKIRELEAAIDEQHVALERETTARKQLLAAYRECEQRLDALKDVENKKAVLESEIEQGKNHHARAEELKEAITEHRARLGEEAYATDERERRQALVAKRDALPFDAEAYQQCRDRAGQVGELERRMQELESVAGRREQLEKAIEQAGQRVAELKEQLGSGVAFGTLPQQIEAMKKQLAGIGFDAGRFEQVRQALNGLSKAGARMTELVHAQQNQQEWRSRLAKLRERLAEIESETERRSDQLAELQKTLSDRDELEAQQKRQREARAEVEKCLHTLQQRLGELNARLAQAKQDRAALADVRKSRKRAAGNKQLYNHLRKAFGRNGIQSLIIEQTLPEIEERANDLLERLTDGKMHVRLETLKDKKTGGTKETLNIIITDEQGTPRAYETFSGGEAFRANFALRIALAQLLAERSDVRIRTLVVDEGFGTQDVQGIQNMVEAIQVIKDDFEKIVVITHLEELKEAFPVRIEVEKDPVEGSSFEVLGV